MDGILTQAKGKEHSSAALLAWSSCPSGASSCFAPSQFDGFASARSPSSPLEDAPSTDRRVRPFPVRRGFASARSSSSPLAPSNKSVRPARVVAR
eukprot:7042207-Prymnesium_polylepis.1